MSESWIGRWTGIATLMMIIRSIWLSIHAIDLKVEPKHAEQPEHLFWLTAVAILLPHLFWRPGYVHLWRYPLAEMVITGGLSLYAAYAMGEGNSLLVVPALVAGYYFHRKTLVWSVLAFVVVLPFAGALLAGLPLIEGVFYVFNNALLYGLGISLNRAFDAYGRTKKLLDENRRQTALIQRQNEALVEYAQQIEDMTLHEERNRIARELHDTIGHTYTSVTVGLDAVICLIDVAPEQAKTKLDVLRGVTRNGLEEVRRNIHQMAPDAVDVTLSRHFAKIASEFALHTATQVLVNTVGEERMLPAQLQLTLIRCLQESLTHAKRMGHATRVSVALEFEQSGVRLTVRDNGTYPEGTTGLTIRSVEERLQSLRGELRLWCEDGGGLVVTCAVPTVS